MKEKRAYIKLRFVENGKDGDGCFDCVMADNCGRFADLHGLCGNGDKGYRALVEIENEKSE